MKEVDGQRQVDPMHMGMLLEVTEEADWVVTSGPHVSTNPEAGKIL